MNWATDIEKMTRLERSKIELEGQFTPFIVEPDGNLILPLEVISKKITKDISISNHENHRFWPIGPAQWGELELPDGRKICQWRPLGSDAYFEELCAKIVICPEGEEDAKLNCQEEILKLVINGQACPFANRIFILPKRQKFLMNTFQFHIPDKETLDVFYWV